MRESYDEGGTNLVYEVIQAARANFPTKELPEERESTMQYAHRLIEAAENASHENFTESQRNLIVNFAYAYLDQQEIEKLAADLDNFSYEYDTYEYKDTVENREEQMEKITEDILNQKTGCLKDWLVEVSEESDIDSDVITARSLLSRLKNAETLSIFTRQPEQEQPETTITFYVAECMGFPVMGEYHNNLTLEEAIKIYESIPAD